MLYMIIYGPQIDKTSSKNIIVNWPKHGAKAMNTLGALVNPNGITKNS